MNKLYNDTAVQAIANAIRAKNGSSDTYTIAEMSTALNDISYYAKPIISNVALATFEADGLPLNSLKVSVEAKQDLHGYDKPWVGGAGKNKYNKNNTNNQPNKRVSTGSGGTYTADGYTATYLVEVKPNTDYTLTTSSNFVSYICWYDETQTRIGGTNWSSGTSKTSPSNAKYIRFDFSTADIDTVQLEQGSTATSFEPYENICPISGWSEVNVSDVDDVDNPTVTQTTTISLGQTVYGGEVDVVNGTSGNKLTHAIVDLGNKTWTMETWGSGIDFYIGLPDAKKPTSDDEKADIISSQYENLSRNELYNTTDDGMALLRGGVFKIRDSRFTDAASFKAAMNGVQLVYELETPTTLTTQPTPIKSLNGQNNLSVDCGEVIELEYFKEV